MELYTYSKIDILISLVLALIMFGIGLSLSLKSFENVFLYPKAILVGLASKMLALPILAFCVVYFAPISLPLKVGFIILAACPGGTTSGFITYFFKGDVALSISLISINSILALLTIPIIVNTALYIFLASTSTIHLPFLETIAQIFSVAILPALIGVFVKYKNEILAAKIEKPMKNISVVLLALVFAIKFFAGESQGGSGITVAEIVSILPYAFMINMLSFFLGLYSGLIPKLGTRASYTIGIEVALQNTTLAFLVAGTLLQDQDMVKPSLVYSMFSFWTAIIFSFAVKRINRIGLFKEFEN